MTARLYTPAEYADVSLWWESHEWDAVPEKFLPSMGLIIEGHAACFLFLDAGSAMAAMEWTVTHPLNTPRESLKAIKILIDAAEKLAKACGKFALFTTVKQASLMRAFESADFQKADEQMTHLLKTWT